MARFEVSSETRRCVGAVISSGRLLTGYWQRVVVFRDDDTFDWFNL